MLSSLRCRRSLHKIKHYIYDAYDVNRYRINIVYIVMLTVSEGNVYIICIYGIVK